MSLWYRAFDNPSGEWRPSVTSAKDTRAAYSPNNRQTAFGIAVRFRDLTTTKTSDLFLSFESGSPRQQKASGVLYTLYCQLTPKRDTKFTIFLEMVPSEVDTRRPGFIP